ncbi:MAG: Do family serine endopeptidase [Salibacteraceae bacterium]|jgi:serine protease Do|nr:Do family serine endopeptidase [Salibacteraceae bacterium]MDP4687366.1 Do family serine endopeptidase [Salibacteraceae bacterium]MDP4763017.1 Do family serine endopeptidase [Salibacteraceae bacterium]MDP4964744.1 Do family serine endopeptidase [Salibacteraceae bacterium]
MKKNIGYFVAAMGGALIAIGSVNYLNNENLEQQLEIEKLRAQHLEAQNQHVNYAVPTAGTIDFSAAAEKTVNAVVHVKTTYEIDGGYYSFDPIRHFFFGDGAYQQKPRMGAGAGSGVIMSDDGYIVTNNHVIDKAASISVTLNDNRTFQAELIGQDPSSDLALLKIDSKDLPKIDFGNSDQIKVGEWVLAVGNPFNLESTVTAGIISAKGRDINILANGTDGSSAVESFIQTDAAVNPGNSGGALVNTRGELIGINAAIKSNTGSYTGYSFAIPVNIVSKVIEDLLEYGTVQRGYLGVTIRNIDSELAEAEKIDDLKGVYIAGIVDRGAAKSAGLKEGDIIKKVAEQSVNSVTELQEQVSKFRPGDEVLVTVNRKGESIDIPLTLRNRFGEEELTTKNELEIHQKLGALLETVPNDLAKELNIKGGVQITELGSGKFRSAGMMKDFIITKVDQNEIKNKEQLFDALSSKNGGVLIEGVYPNGKKAYYGFGL